MEIELLYYAAISPFDRVVLSISPSSLNHRSSTRYTFISILTFHVLFEFLCGWVLH